MLTKDIYAQRNADPLDARTGTIRVLIVDDNRDAAMSMGMLLRLLGYETSVAFDGVEALVQAEKLHPDAVLLDIGLPLINGLEVARRIRAQDWGASTLLVAMTGWGLENDYDRSIKAGFDRHLIKPVEPTTLVALLAARKSQANAARS